MFEQWLEMEQFYFNDMWIFVALSCFLGIIFFASISYIKKRAVQVIVVVTLIVWIVTGIFVTRGYDKHQEMIQQNSYINATNRTFEKKIFFDFPYSYSELSLYKQGYMKDYFEPLPFYKSEQLSEEIEYKGSDGTYYYVEINGDVYYTSQRLLSFSDQAEAPQRIGVQYHLTDNQFESIGFITPSSIFLESYIVPRSLKDLEVNDADKANSIYQSDQQIGLWISP
ncbi:hypothetical protein HYQ40_00845 [Aerococcaceae bacterium DSM 111021]|nr:hypothetical protein [Aerococcaceae bacterium DSM 111021]